MSSSLSSIFAGATAWDIVAWHRPVASGMLLASLLTLWYVFVIHAYTITTFVSRVATMLFIIGAVGAVTRRVSVSSADMAATMDRMYESMRPRITRAVDAAVALMTWRDFKTSTKVFAATLVTACLGNMMSDSTLLLVALALTFTAPFAYERHRSEINHMMRKAQQAIDQALDMVRHKLAAHRPRPNTYSNSGGSSTTTATTTDSARATADTLYRKAQ